MVQTIESGPEAVANALWDRVRRLARLTNELAAAEALGELDGRGQETLDRGRQRLARAVVRAQLADELSDQLADLRALRTARTAAVAAARSRATS